MNMKENYTLFSHLRSGKKEDKNSGSHVFRAGTYSFDFNTAIYRNCARSLEYRAEMMFQYDEVSEQHIFRRVVPFFFLSLLACPSYSARILAHRQDCLARGGLISQTGVFARRETRPRKFRICIKALVFAADDASEMLGRGFRDGETE